MTYEQFKQTKFYTGMFKYMLTQYSPEFTETVLKESLFYKDSIIKHSFLPKNELN
jgi:hypothetical protein